MLSNLLIWLIVLLLPTQLGLHFWPSFTRVSGIRIDYLSPTLYLIDPLLILLVVDNFVSLLNFFKKHLTNTLLVVLFIITNIAFSVSPYNSLFWWLRTLLYFLVSIVFCLRRLKWSRIKTPLLIGTTVVVLIEICQLYLQSSIGGLFYYLGERAYSGSTPGLGRLNLFGLEIIRPQSIFSHSNSMAGYLLIVFYLFVKKTTKPWHKLIPFIGIILSSSKAVIVSLAMLIFYVKPEIIILASLTITFLQPLIQNNQASWQPLKDRLFYFPYLGKIFLQNPITGTGLGGFIPSLGKLLPGSLTTPSKLQPIHNLPFLAIAELGLLGSLLLIYTNIKQKTLKYILKPEVLGLLALVLFTGSFDHYTWTLPQNKLIFLLALSIMF